VFLQWAKPGVRDGQGRDLGWQVLAEPQVRLTVNGWSRRPNYAQLRVADGGISLPRTSGSGEAAKCG
jgi:hypothetical protein